MTAREAVRRLDELRPNSLPLAEKLTSLCELENKLRAALFGGRGAPGAVDEDHVLTAGTHGAMYYYWLCARIDFEGGDPARAEADMEAFERIFEDYRSWIVRSGGAGGKLKAGD